MLLSDLPTQPAALWRHIAEDGEKSGRFTADPARLRHQTVDFELLTVDRVFDSANLFDAGRIVGEFTVKGMMNPDQQWFGKINGYIKDNRLSFFYAGFNNDMDKGLLTANWMDVDQNKQRALQPLLAPLLTP